MDDEAKLNDINCKLDKIPAEQDKFRQSVESRLKNIEKSLNDKIETKC